MRRFISLLLMGVSIGTWAFQPSDYLVKFSHYWQWHRQLPAMPDAEFLAFIDGDSPLSRKLREQWLYQLAWNKDWKTFLAHYQASNDISLQCYASFARYQGGEQQLAITEAEKIWLSATSLPKPCDNLFTTLLSHHQINPDLIKARILLALEHNNASLASYLLKQFTPPRVEDAKLLLAIHQNYRTLTNLGPGEFHGDFYLYGLKRLVAQNAVNKALQYWQSSQAKQLLNHAQKQQFIAYLTLYKALRNQADTQQWFKKVEPAYYNETLLTWEIRHHLKLRDWQEVERLIGYLSEKENPCWQYWLARAWEARGKKEAAKQLYEQLASMRHYYGFLASQRLNKAFSFENEPVANVAVVKAYAPFTEEIQTLYQNKQTGEASRLLNDFLSELPKNDKSALIYWLDTHLSWYGKSVYLASNQELNNQLRLRFPLAYQQTIDQYAKNYQIPPALVFAIIRQESGFREDVVSSAGAQGLMQIMPATAKVISKTERIAYSHPQQLFSSQKNINIGVAYLKQLGRRFQEHPIFISAAYNAGPRQVTHWIQNHPPTEMDIWIETLPWQETRNYLKNIVAFWAIYQYRLQQKPNLDNVLAPLKG